MEKVMLVEDEEFILQGIRYIIEWKEMSMEVVHMAHNGREALELFKKEPVDIVVTDVEMPFMSGLELMEEIRKLSPRTRCIILSGYDEFEYARKAMKLDVEEYILKPVNEELLKQALIHAREHLNEIDRKRAGSMEGKIGWHRFLKGKLKPEEEAEFYHILPAIESDSTVFASLMKIDTRTLNEKQGLNDILVELQNETHRIKVICLAPDTLFLLLYLESGHTEEDVLEYYKSFQDRLESRCGIMSFLTLSHAIDCYSALPQCYKLVSRLQKYKMLEGYGTCINENHIKDRKSGDVVIDEQQLRKLILKKDKEGALNYIEDLFINNLKSEVNVDVLYQTALKIAMLLHDIKVEYKLAQSRNFQNLSEIIEKIYQADDIFGLKTIFISEISEIITYLHTEDSQYTPVVKQIMAEVQKNYKEDMNLKTLSYKYHMNASYLGQIFQKEAGCSFAQYLSNIKNGVAKDLILNTNMKINDIAREVGYPDTSYFYRKFKQCYGVSPASLRNMKKY
ncbi:MAG: response regulator [Lachnospiraceae bacterium]|nr:response regulator [Lachnospiraceae bacterium]